LIVSPTTFDSHNRVIITGLGSGYELTIIAVDFESVKLITISLWLNTLSFSSYDNYVYGFGTKELRTGDVRTVLKFNAATQQIVEIGEVPGYFPLYQNSAIDSNSQILYGLLVPNTSSRFPCHLLGVSTVNASIITSPVICDIINGFPCLIQLSFY